MLVVVIVVVVVVVVVVRVQSCSPPRDMASTSRGRDGWEDGTSREDGPALTTYLLYLGRDRTRKEPLRWTEECAVFAFSVCGCDCLQDILELKTTV